MSPTKPDQSGPNVPVRSPSLAPHPDYWIKGADLHLLLGHTLYRIHSHFFIRESRYWRNKLAGPTSPGDEPLLLGSNSTNALVLEDKPVDFDCLLYVFYNTRFGDYSQLRLKQWITILRYSTKWEFSEVKELAIRYILNFEMDVIERIALYQENKLPEKYLFPLYMQIASREELLSLEESRALGYETLVLIHQARERLRSQGPMNNRLLSPIRTDLKHTDVIDIVASTFNISLASTTGSPNPGNTVQSPAPSLTPPILTTPVDLTSTRRTKNEGLEVAGYDFDDGTYDDWDLEVVSNVASVGSDSWDDTWDIDGSTLSGSLAL